MIDIVPANLEDPYHCRALIELLDLYACDPMGGYEPLADSVKSNLAAALRRRSDTCIFFAREDETMVGLVIAFEGFSTFSCKPLLNIHDLIVKPEYRGKGIATLLLQACEQEAIRTGCCKLTLEVLQGNEKARRIYTNFGFAPYQLGPIQGHALFFEKKV